MDSQRKKKLLRKYLDSRCSKKELEELLSLHFSKEDFEILGEELESDWGDDEKLSKLSREKGDRIFNDIIQGGKEIQPEAQVSGRHWFFKLAAVFLTIVVASLGFIIIERLQYQQEKTGYGETKNLLLPDGSTVTLNSNSSIRYKKAWDSGEERIISLKGEAFFDVVHQSNLQKFIVKTKEMEVEVLGTSFNVSSRKTKSFVVLQEGKIKLDVQGAHDVVMVPGELVEFGPDKKVIRKREVNPSNYSSWRDNLLTFQSAPLSEIAESIENNYGLKIKIEDKKLLKERFTGTFPADEDISLLLDMLSKTYHFDIVRINDEFIFKSRK